MQAHEAHPLGSLGVIGGYHSPLARCQRLGRIKTEARKLTDLSYPFSPVFGRESVCGVFDDSQAMHSRKCLDLIHVTRLPAKMHWDDRFGLWRDSPRRIFGIYIHRVGINVNEHRLGTHVGDRLSGCRKCCCWQQHFIASLNSSSFERQV